MNNVNRVVNLAKQEMAREPSLLIANAFRSDYKKPVIYESILSAEVVSSTIKELFSHYAEKEAEDYSVVLIIALHHIRHFYPKTHKELESMKTQAAEGSTTEKYKKARLLLEEAAEIIGLERDFYTQIPLGEFAGKEFGIKELADDAHVNDPLAPNPFWNNPIEQYIGTRGRAANNSEGAKNGAAIKYLNEKLPGAIRERKALISKLLGSCGLSITRQTVATCLRPARK